MGRQVHFHMLVEDQKEFLRVVQDRDSTVVTLRDFNSSQVAPIAEAVTTDRTLCLWNREILPNLERKWIPDPGYYRIDTLKAPILEFAPSFTATWEGKPALGQGRLFGNFEPHLGKPESFRRWYEKLVGWIRRHYRKNPAGTGGYVGPAAYEFYEQGGYLLPSTLPPRTKEWLAEIGRQHERFGRKSRAGSKAKEPN